MASLFKEENGKFILQLFDKKDSRNALIVVIIVAGIFGLVGGGLVGLAVYNILQNYTPDEPIDNKWIIISAFGSVFLLSPIAIIFNFNRSTALSLRSIIFDNNSQQIEFKDKIGEAIVPYSDISKIKKRLYVQTVTNKNRTTKYYYYICYLKKIDGSLIDIFDSSTQEETLQLYNSLIQYFQNNNLETNFNEEKNTVNIFESKDSESHIYYWEPQRSLLVGIFAMLPFLFFLGSLLKFVSKEEEIMPLIIISIFLFIFGGIFIYLIYLKITSIGTFDCIKISKNVIETGTISKSNKIFKKRKSKPLNSIKKVCFSYKTIDSECHQIVLLGAGKPNEKVEENEDESTNNFGEFLEYIEKFTKGLNVDLTGLYTTDIIKLEKKIQDSIIHFGGEAI